MSLVYFLFGTEHHAPPQKVLIGFCQYANDVSLLASGLTTQEI